MDVSPIFQLFLAIAIMIAASELFGVISRFLGQPRVFGALLAGVIIGPSLLNFMSWPIFTDAHETREVAGITLETSLAEAYEALQIDGLPETEHPGEMELSLETSLVEVFEEVQGPGYETHEFIDIGIEALAELGVMFLMFNVGLDVHLRELLAVGRAAIFGGTAGALLPTGVGALILLAYGHETEVALFAGVALAATSVSISAQTLLELRLLKTKEGNAVLASAIVDDILAILLLSLVTATVGSAAAEESNGSLVAIAGKMAGYLFFAVVIAWYALPQVIRWLSRHEQTRQLIAPTAVVFALVFGWSAEAFGGVAAITGAFIAGMGLSRTRGEAKDIIHSSANRITYAFLAPVFFVSIGLKVDLADFPVEAIIFTAIVMGAAVLTKVVGCGIGARIGGGLGNLASLRVGVCMVSRGEVGLIIMNEGFRRGVFDDAGYVDAGLLVVVLLTTVVTPPLVRWAFKLGDDYTEILEGHKPKRQPVESASDA